ncbi:MoaD/ThiS family protein [Rubrobacter indicoceani]|uniref:MoaD/ThiS family protein n=1 Tax=Rubrobacter indicoceani TaxID=2051957 RepID=UPI000E5BC9E3|nr:MoaD/ThiS family protein [Rubrobacter indicoceani]
MQGITVVLFGAAADRAGTRTVELSAAGVSTLDDVWFGLVEAHPGLAPMQTMLAFAVNGEYAERGAPVAAGDEVAVLPPVSGG